MNTTLPKLFSPCCPLILLAALLAANSHAQTADTSAGCPTQLAAVTINMDQPIPAAIAPQTSQACEISWDQLQSKPRTTIDIRDRNAFAKVSLQGSLNLPLSSLRHRDFLKAQALVLIDDGKSPSALLRACSELKTQGFTDVAVLIGGLRTLHAHGAVLDADAAAIHSLYQISPAEFDSEFGRPGWRTVAADAAAAANAQNKIALQEALDATPLAPQLSGLLKKNPRDALILVASAKETKLDALAALPPDAKARVLILSGGLDAHDRYQRQQLNVVAQAGKPLVRPCNEL